MNDLPVDLDQRRSPTGRMATEIRRHSLKALQADQDALRRRQEALEAQLVAEPAETWPDAVAKAEYLIRLFALTADGQDERRKKLIARALADLTRLCDSEGTPP